MRILVKSDAVCRINTALDSADYLKSLFFLASCFFFPFFLGTILAYP